MAVFPRQVALVCVVLPLLGASSPAAAEDARRILIQSLTPTKTTYLGEQVSEVVDSARGRSLELRQRVYRKGNRLLIRYQDGRVVYDDGSQTLFYRPPRRIAEKGPSNLGEEIVLQRRRLLRGGRSELQHLPDDTIAGRSCFVVLVKPPRGPTRKIWIDKQTHLQLAHEETTFHGVKRNTYFTSIDFSATPSEADLDPRIPPDVRIVEQGRRPIRPEQALLMARAWGGLLKPAWIPQGYQFRGYFRHQFRGRPMLALVYGPPGRSRALTVFQGVAGEGGGTMMARKTPPRALAVTRGRADVVVVGDLPEEDLRKVMDSVQPEP
jgi:hypothetical protein